MTDRHVSNGQESRHKPGDEVDGLSTGNANDLDDLKRLLFSRELNQLHQLEERLDSARMDTESLSHLLPGAVNRAQSQDRRLAKSLAPLIGESIENSIRKDPRSIVDAISPIMGPAIRESIRLAIRGMVQSLNKTLEYSVSWKGLTWRWEALTTGKSFAEVVLLHTLIYRVSQVFLIHRETGLLIRHESMQDNVRDVDLTSGMLTAIQDFVRDSFGAGEDESLSTMAFGEDQTIWLETGPEAFLAAVVEGEAPARVRVLLKECIENIHVDFADELASYQGDDSQLAATSSMLRECLNFATSADEESMSDDSRGTWSAWIWGLAVVTILGLLVFWGIRFAQHRRHQRELSEVARFLNAPQTVNVSLEEGVLSLSGQAPNEWIEFVEANAPRLKPVRSLELQDLKNSDAGWLLFLKEIRKEPGIVVTYAAADQGRYVLEGLRDNYARQPVDILQEAALDVDTVSMRWQSYRSSDPKLLGRRLLTELKAPGSVELNLDDGVLRISGEATGQWIEALRFQAVAIAGDTIRLDISQLVDIGLARLRSISQEVERSAIAFEPGEAAIAAGQDGELSQLADNLKLLFDTADSLERRIRVVIEGYTDEDSEDSSESPTRLSQERARTLWQEMRTRDVPTMELIIKGRGLAVPSVAAAEGIGHRRICICSVSY